MSIPTPSFMKIRINILIISFLILCFIVGLVKDVFSAEECSGMAYVGWVESREICGPASFNYGLANYGTRVGAPGWQLGSVSLAANSPNQMEGVNLSSPEECKPYYAMDFVLYKYENGTWNKQPYTGKNWIHFGLRYPETTANKVHPQTAPVLTYPLVPSVDNLAADGNCKDSCEELKGQIINGFNSEGRYTKEGCIDGCLAVAYVPPGTYIQPMVYDPETGFTSHPYGKYTGDQCEVGQPPSDCDGAGEETRADAEKRCSQSGKSLQYYDNVNCIGSCSCSEEETVAETQKCGIWGVKSFSEVTCKAICNGCQEFRKDAEKACGGSSNVTNFKCSDTAAIHPSFDCKEEVKEEPEETPDKPEKKPDPETPPADDPEQPPDNPWDKALKKNLDKLIKQGDSQQGSLDRGNDLLEHLGDSLSTINKNLNKALDEANGKDDELGDEIGDDIDDLGDDIGDDLNDLANDIGDDLDDIGNEIGDVGDTLDEMNQGEYTAPTEETPYETDEVDFGERTSNFLESMRNTSLFSIPNKISSSIPGGGSPLLTIQTGPTFGGEHTIDFSNWSNGLTTLKYIFQIMGMMVAIRIVTIKR